ncbi:uncharacterized protein B0H18DRAFT_879688, partial [Fomitopsis serialis]|uniref:uncharacterized protein n=1 Tax=Fomitopsis serialis TaxID=139415 RepID=UPI002007D286
RLNETNGMVFVKGTNTRGCRLYFDKPITYYKIHDVVDAGAPGTKRDRGVPPGYEMPKEGIRDLKLWSREWERGFLVEVGWNADSEDGFMDDTMGGRAACEWRNGQGQGGLIPALEEVKAFLPLWAQPTKTTDGLVEAWMRFSI